MIDFHQEVLEYRRVLQKRKKCACATRVGNSTRWVTSSPNFLVDPGGSQNVVDVSDTVDSLMKSGRFTAAMFALSLVSEYLVFTFGYCGIVHSKNRDHGNMIAIQIGIRSCGKFISGEDLDERLGRMRAWNLVPLTFTDPFAAISCEAGLPLIQG